MRRWFPGHWLPFLAALLAAPLARQGPVELRAHEQTLRSGDSPAAAIGYALPVARFHPALHGRYPLDRHGARAAALPADEANQLVAPHRIPHPVEPSAGPLAETARHFPLFPTGPPSNG